MTTQYISESIIIDIKSTADLRRAKAKHAELIKSLIAKYSDNLSFSAEHISIGFKTQKKIFTISSKEILTELKADIANIIQVDDAIRGTEEKTKFKPHPILRTGVDYLRIWANKAVGDKRLGLTKDKIIEKLETQLRQQRRINTEKSLRNQVELLTQIDYFKGSDEQQYILRSAPSKDCIVKVYYSNGDSERIRLTRSGLFLVGANFDEVRMAIPNDDKLSGANTMSSIYEEIAPIPYFIARSGSLYPESKVNAIKARIEAERATIADNKGLRSKNGTNDLEEIC